LFPILLSLSRNPFNCPIVLFPEILFHCSSPLSFYFHPCLPLSVVKIFLYKPRK
jgi:hypothetical protein